MSTYSSLSTLVPFICEPILICPWCFLMLQRRMSVIDIPYLFKEQNFTISVDCSSVQQKTSTNLWFVYKKRVKLQREGLELTWCFGDVLGDMWVDFATFFVPSGGCCSSLSSGFQILLFPVFLSTQFCAYREAFVKPKVKVMWVWWFMVKSCVMVVSGISLSPAAVETVVWW